MPQHALLAHDLVRSLGGRRVLDGVCLTASPGHRIGLIGENGVGKSTLLRLLAGVDEPDAGSVTRPAGLGFLHQEMPFDAGATIAAVLDDALREAREDLAELERLSEELARVPEDDPGHQERLDVYGRRLEQAQDRRSWDADRHAALVLDGLGLGAFGHDRTLGSLSGGQRGRPALAALLPLRFVPGDLVARAEEGDRPLVSLRDVRVAGRLAVDGLEVAAGDRLLVTGVNGAGKSTLLAVLAGRLPAEGEVYRKRWVPRGRARSWSPAMTAGCADGGGDARCAWNRIAGGRRRFDAEPEQRHVLRAHVRYPYRPG
ncbi:ATP-binding cassette domain-containing protein [Streptomyces luteogriseus]|uniref:ATP-binding cassette domain-containing protein n=1 Tax=Streptomyces luteogriseus TaxID=68233 RepID=UPI0038074027